MQVIRRGLLPLALSLALAPARAAWADQGPVEEAQTLFTQGRAALEKGDYTTACATLEKSLALMPRPSTLGSLAQCEEHQGKLLSAAKHMEQGIDLLAAGDPRIPPAKAQAKELDARIPRVVLKLSGPGPARASARLDGAPVLIDQFAEGVAVDPGRHSVVVSVWGAPDQETTIDVAVKETRTVTIVLPPVAPQVVKQTARGSGLKTAGYVAFGVGAAGAILAAVTGGVLVHDHAEINADCPNKFCSPAGRSLINGVGPLNVANGIGWGLGVTAVTAGAILLAVSGTTGDETTSSTALVIGNGIWLRGSF